MLLAPYVRYHILVEWPPIGKWLLTRLTPDMLSLYKYLIVNLVFSPSRCLELECPSDFAVS